MSKNCWSIRIRRRGLKRCLIQANKITSPVELIIIFSAPLRSFPDHQNGIPPAEARLNRRETADGRPPALRAASRLTPHPSRIDFLLCVLRVSAISAFLSRAPEWNSARGSPSQSSRSGGWKTTRPTGAVSRLRPNTSRLTNRFSSLRPPRLCVLRVPFQSARIEFRPRKPVSIVAKRRMEDHPPYGSCESPQA